jgi:hypothetical protein
MDLINKMIRFYPALVLGTMVRGPINSYFKLYGQEKLAKEAAKPSFKRRTMVIDTTFPTSRHFIEGKKWPSTKTSKVHSQFVSSATHRRVNQVFEHVRI